MKPDHIGLGITRPCERPVLRSNPCQFKPLKMVNSVGVFGPNLAFPVKVANGFTGSVCIDISRTSSPIPEEENVGLDMGIHTNRKRRLDHLTWEEKLKRKKLKNRVAAQTSRDRKKALMDELEFEVKTLQEENQRLVLENFDLRKKAQMDEVEAEVRAAQVENKRLLQENFDLLMEKEKLTAENQQLQEKLSNQKMVTSQKQSVVVGCSPLKGPAVSVVDPLPQGSGPHPATGLCKERALWKILTFCILSQISLQNTENQTITLTNLKSLQQVYFEKLMKANKKSLHRQMAQLLTEVKIRASTVKWWGPRQKTWNPVESKAHV